MNAACTIFAGTSTPSNERSRVAQASCTTVVTKPKSSEARVTASIHMWLMLPTTTTSVTPFPSRKDFSPVCLRIANGWGDPANGPHSNYIKMAGGTASGVHTHSESYYGVVIAGVVANEPPGSKQDRPLAPGSYWYQKGNEPHVTKCISQTECIFFVTAKGAFDYLPVK